MAALRAVLAFLTEGSPHRKHQAREVKLLDVLYEMLRVTHAGIDLTRFAGDKVRHRLHRLVNRVIMAAVRDNLLNKQYVAARSAARYYYDSASSSVTYVRETLEYIGSETGSKTLFELLFLNNPRLLAIVDGNVVATACRRLEAKGVKAAGIFRFLATICSCNGRSLVQNQNLVLHALFSDTSAGDTTRHRLLIETTECSSSRRVVPKVVKAMAMKLPPSLVKLRPHPTPLGADMLHSGLKNIVISWKGRSCWQAGDDSLFFTPEDLSLPVVPAVPLPPDLAAYQAQLPSSAFPGTAHEKTRELVSAAPEVTSSTTPKPPRAALSLGRLLLASLSHRSSMESHASDDTLGGSCSHLERLDSIPDDASDVDPVEGEARVQLASMLQRYSIESTASDVMVDTAQESPRDSLAMQHSSSNVIDGIAADTTTTSARRLSSESTRQLVPGNEWVSLDAAAWVLDPEALFSIHFPGRTWKEEQVRMKTDKKAKMQYDRLSDLVNYYRLQLLLFVEVLRGGNLTAVKVLRRQFSYELLLSAIGNDKLPYVLRTAFTTILHHCYVRVFPHEPLPQMKRVHVWADIPATAPSSHPLPTFTLPPSHPAMTLYQSDTFRQYPYAIKFAVLQALLHAALSGVAKVSVTEATLSGQTFASAMLEVMHDLILFGFYADHAAQKVVAELLLHLLENRNGQDSAMQLARSPRNNATAAVKKQICGILVDMSRLWQHAEVTLLLTFFKRRYADARKPLHLSVEQWRHRLCKQMARVLDRARQIDLVAVSHGALDVVCMDLMMHEDADLTEAALALQLQANSRKASVFDALSHSILLRPAVVGPDPSAAYTEVTELLPTLQHYVHIFPQPDLCGTVNPTRGVAGVSEAIVGTLERLQRLTCDSTRVARRHQSTRRSSFWGLRNERQMPLELQPHSAIQGMLLRMNVHELLFALLVLPLASAADATVVVPVQEECCKLLVLLATMNPFGQYQLFQHVAVLWPKIDAVDGLVDVVIAIFANNNTLASQLPQEALWFLARRLDHLAAVLDDAAVVTIGILADFLVTFTAPQDAPIKKHQILVFDVLVHPQFQNIMPDYALGVTGDMDVNADLLIGTPGYMALRRLPETPAALEYFQKILVLLAALAAGKNRATELRCQQRFPINWCLTALLDAKLPLGLKYAVLRFFTEVYLYTDVELQFGPTATALRQVLLQCASVVREFGNGVRRASVSSDAAFAQLLSTYVFDGVLVFITAFFTQHGIVPDSDAEMLHTMDELRLAVVQLGTTVTLSSHHAKVLAVIAAKEMNTAIQVVRACTRALHLDNVEAMPPPRPSQSTTSQLEFDPKDTSFEQFQRDIQHCDEVAEVITQEAKRLVQLWTNVETMQPATTRFAFYSKVIRFLSERPAAASTLPVLEVLRELVTQYWLSEEERKQLQVAEAQEAADTYRSEQTLLAKCGAPGLIVKLLAGSTSPAVKAKAIELGSALLRGGNGFVQELFYSSLKDGNERFFLTIERILRSNIDVVKELRRKAKFKSEAVTPAPRRRASLVPTMATGFNVPTTMDVVAADSVLPFLTELIMGHFQPTQCALLDQRTTLGLGTSVNLLGAAASFLSYLVKEDVPLTAAECTTATHCYHFLAQSMQGPCAANQDYLARSAMVDVFTKLLRATLATGNAPLPTSEAVKQLQSIAAEAMVSLLEGRADRRVEESLQSVLSLDAIKRRLIAIYLQFQAEKKRHLADVTWDERFLEEGVNLLTLAKCVFHDAALHPSKRQLPAPRRVNFTDQRLFEEAFELYQETRLYDQVYKFFSAMHCSVEILWGSDKPRLDTVYFPLPSHCRMLEFVGAKKSALLASLNYKSSQRLVQFVRAVGGMNEEMAHVEALSQFALYNALRPYIPHFKHASFLLALFMNLIMLVAIQHPEQSSGVNYIPDKLQWFMHLFGLLQIFLSTAVVIFMLVISIPLAFRRRLNAMIQHSLTEYKERKAAMEALDLLPLDVLKLQAEQRVQRWTRAVVHLIKVYIPFFKFIALIYLLQLTLVHAFPTFPSWTLYTVLFLPIVRNTRQYLDTSSSVLGLVYTFTYDVLFEKLAAFYVVYLGTALAATYYHPIFYFYHLLDLVIMSTTLQNVVLAVIKPARLLGLTALLCIVLFYYYTMALFFFDPSDMTDASSATPFCHTLLDCFVTVLHRGLTTGGGLGNYLSTSIQHPPNFYKRTEYWIRLVFDVSFFAVRIVMLNMVFGITIDTFGGLRTDAAEMIDVKRNQCFICGRTRATFDKQYLAAGITDGFEQHITHEHNMWHYLFFMVHLESLDATKCTGPEAFVKAQLARHGVSWFPQGVAKGLAAATPTSVRDEIGDIKQHVKTLAEQADAALNVFQQRLDHRARKHSTRAV
ncbi:type I inositol triphosphate receptor [Achlya hypogyna]|uniref:Type I inositol triphosphate receptor n=1 Tax=Achlya hypogyna TaxID=1202772 RepID=A0A1V9Z879_ACHHY|nr:type I inositol triphosphate receptor [Achlya hypogyna]